MEIEFQKNKIIFDRELSNLDKFVLKFVKILDSQKVKYVVVSGYVSILFGRSRGTEDVDLLVEKLNFEKFEKLWSALIFEFDCINADSVENAYNDYLVSNMAIRFAEKGEHTPNMEFKFCKVKLDDYSLNNSIEVLLNGNKLLISPLELQIAYKLYLGSEKDIEDAIFLWNLFEQKLDQPVFDEFMKQLNIQERKKVLYEQV